MEARQHARRYITPHGKLYPNEVNKAAGLLAFSPDTRVSDYRVIAPSTSLGPNS